MKNPTKSLHNWFCAFRLSLNPEYCNFLPTDPTVLSRQTVSQLVLDLALLPQIWHSFCKITHDYCNSLDHTFAAMWHARIDGQTVVTFDRGFVMQDCDFNWEYYSLANGWRLETWLWAAGSEDVCETEIVTAQVVACLQKWQHPIVVYLWLHYNWLSET